MYFEILYKLSTTYSLVSTIILIGKLENILFRHLDNVQKYTDFFSFFHIEHLVAMGYLKRCVLFFEAKLSGKKWKFSPLRTNSKLQINGQRFIDSYTADVTYKSAYIYPYIFKSFVSFCYKVGNHQLLAVL